MASYITPKWGLWFGSCMLMLIDHQSWLFEEQTWKSVFHLPLHQRRCIMPKSITGRTAVRQVNCNAGMVPGTSSQLHIHLLSIVDHTKQSWLDPGVYFLEIIDKYYTARSYIHQYYCYLAKVYNRAWVRIDKISFLWNNDQPFQFDLRLHFDFREGKPQSFINSLSMSSVVVMWTLLKK
jgi:hypothetical protein